MSNSRGTQEPPSPNPASPISPDLERHSRKCEVCRHPDRQEIEEAFINWQRPAYLARIFNIKAGKDSIYRHAHAIGLFAVRRHNIRQALEFIIECGSTLEPKASDVLKAIVMHARFNDEGQYQEVPQRYVVERHNIYSQRDREPEEVAPMPQRPPEHIPPMPPKPAEQRMTMDRAMQNRLLGLPPNA